MNVRIIFDKDMNSDQLQDCVPALQRMRITTKNQNNITTVVIKDIVHVIATEEDLNKLIIKAGSTIIEPVKCFQGLLHYMVVPLFPKKGYNLAWTDSMDFYVVGIYLYFSFFFNF